LQPRFEQAVDAQAQARRAGPTHRAIGDGGAKQLRVLARLHYETGVALMLRNFLEHRVERLAVGGGKRGAGSLIVRTQRGDDVPVARRDGGECGGAQPFERSERLGQPAHEIGGEIERRFAEMGPRIRRVQVGRFLAPQLHQLGAETAERLRQPGAAGARARAPQHGFLERRDRAGVGAGMGAEP
jgi:hypothetical protein